MWVVMRVKSKTENLYCSTKKSSAHTYDFVLNEKLKKQRERVEMNASRMNRVNRVNRMNNSKMGRSDSRNWRE